MIDRRSTLEDLGEGSDSRHAMHKLSREFRYPMKPSELRAVIERTNIEFDPLMSIQFYRPSSESEVGFLNATWSFCLQIDVRGSRSRTTKPLGV